MPERLVTQSLAMLLSSLLLIERPEGPEPDPDPFGASIRTSDPTPLNR